MWVREGSRGNLFFYSFGEFMIAVCLLTLLKVNLNITVEAYKVIKGNERRKKGEIFYKAYSKRGRIVLGV